MTILEVEAKISSDLRRFCDSFKFSSFGNGDCLGLGEHCWKFLSAGVEPEGLGSFTLSRSFIILLLFHFASAS